MKKALAIVGVTLAVAIERWKTGATILILLGAVATLAALFIAAPLAIVGAIFDLPQLASKSNIALGSALFSLPYLLTRRETANALGNLLNSMVREN